MPTGNWSSAVVAALALGVAFGCGPPPPPAPAITPTAGSAEKIAEFGAPPPRTSPPPEPGPPAVPPGPCRDDPAGRLAWVSCDGAMVRVDGPLLFHPQRTAPVGRARAVLDAVARLLEERQDILLLRIEVYASTPAAAARPRQRRETLAAQRRASAIYRDLWKRGGIWAERLDAVGYGGGSPVGEAERWVVVLRIVQRASRQ